MDDDDAMRGTPGGDGVTPAGGIDTEVASQPACWLRAAGLAASVAHLLPAPGNGSR